MFKLTKLAILFIAKCVFVSVFVVGCTVLIPMYAIIAFVSSSSWEEFKQDFPSFLKDLYGFALARWNIV